MDQVRFFLNPVARLGSGKYSLTFPLLATSVVFFIVEYINRIIFSEALLPGIIIIVTSVTLIIYFSLRDGIRGGMITLAVVIIYYAYLIYLYVDDKPQAIETTIFLGASYLLTSLIIGWLRQSLDRLIQREKAARTRAEESQELFYSVLQQLPVGIKIAYPKKGVVEGNRSLERFLKRRVKKNFLKEKEYIASRSYKKGKRLTIEELPIYKAYEKGIRVSDEIEYKREDGKMLYLQMNATPVKNRKKEIIAVVSTVYDLTNEREQEKRKDNFINMASHELKTPITSMNLYLDLLQKKMEAQADKKFIEPIGNVRQQTQRLKELVSDLLDVSRIQTGKLFINKQDFALNELMTEVCTLFQETTRDKKIVLENSKQVYVNADRFRIYQVITNLITNAIKYSSKGSEIVISEEERDGKVIVSVKDNGIGIDKREQKRIFDVLYQVPDAKEKTFPGLGMGLFISKEIIQKHKGKIWVEGEKGKGSTFYFELPLSNRYANSN